MEYEHDIGHYMSDFLEDFGIACKAPPTLWVRTPRGPKEFVQLREMGMLSLIVWDFVPLIGSKFDCKVEIEELAIISEGGERGAEKVIVVFSISEAGRIHVLYRQVFHSPEADLKDLDDPKEYEKFVKEIEEKVVQALEALMKTIEEEKGS